MPITKTENYKQSKRQQQGCIVKPVQHNEAQGTIPYLEQNRAVS